MAETSQNIYLTHTGTVKKKEKFRKDDFAMKLLTISLEKEDYVRKESKTKKQF